MLVKNIMTSDVKCCAPETSLAAAARLMASHQCGIIPVVDARQKLVGVITDRDICLAVARRFQAPDEIPVREVMATKVHTCSPDERPMSVLKLMKDHAVRRVPVVTVDGRVTGVISIDDLVLRAESHRGADVAEDSVLDALRSISARTVTA